MMFEKRIQVRINGEMLKELKRIANKRGLTVAGFIRWLIYREIESDKNEK